MKCSVIYGTILFPAVKTAVIQKIVASGFVEGATLFDCEEAAEKVAELYGGDWLIPMHFDGKIIDEDTEEDDEEGICPSCNGSGEGMHEDTACPACKGRGEC
jgi:hypothetical protein